MKVHIGFVQNYDQLFLAIKFGETVLRMSRTWQFLPPEARAKHKKDALDFGELLSKCGFQVEISQQLIED